MSLDIEKICRTCLALSGPLLSLYENNGSTGCIADMLRDFTKMKPQRLDGMPEKVCLSCISEINRSYSFKIKCENSERTLRQLVPVPDTKTKKEEESVDKANPSKRQVVSPQKLSQTEKSTKNQTESEDANTQHLIVNKKDDKNLDQNPFNKTENLHGDISLIEQEIEDFKAEISKNDEHKISSVHIVQGETIKLKSFVSLNRTKTSPDQQLQHDNIVYEIQEENEDCESVVGDVETAYYLVSDSQENDNEIADEEVHQNLQNLNNEDMTDYGDEDIVNDGNVEDIEDTDSAAIFQEILNDHEERIVKQETKTSPREISHPWIGRSVRQRKATVKKMAIEESENVKKERKEFKCTLCPMTFVFWRNYNKHYQKHHPDAVSVKQDSHIVSENKYQISPDDNGSSASNTYNEEISMSAAPVITEVSDIFPVAEAKHHCPRCKAGFAEHKSLKNHLKQNKCTKQTFSCGKCKKVFVMQENLREHMKIHLKPQFECTECFQIYETNDKLSMHMIDEHKRKIKYQCKHEGCKKVFSMLSTLKDHMRTHSGEKPFLCSICGKSFSQNANLKQHLMRHTNTKPYKCDECPVSFVSKGELFSHKRTHTGDHPFVCDVCHSVFTTTSSLAKHKRKHTGERPYGCEFCPMRFSALNILKNHRRTHTGEKPYKCMYCNRAFTQKSDCTIHMRTHTGEKRYICPVCGVAFQQSTTMRTHIKTHSLEELDKSNMARDGESQGTDGVVIDNAADRSGDDDELIKMDIQECDRNIEEQI